MRYFLSYSDKFNSSHLLFLLALIMSIFCLNTHARSLFRECTAGHVRLVLTAPLCFSPPAPCDTYECIDSTLAFTHALPAGPKIRREVQRDKYGAADISKVGNALRAQANLQPFRANGRARRPIHSQNIGYFALHIYLRFMLKLR